MEEKRLSDAEVTEIQKQLGSGYGDISTKINALLADRRALVAEVASLREGLREFGIHHDFLPRCRYYEWGSCNCGLGDLINHVAASDDT